MSNCFLFKLITYKEDVVLQRGFEQNISFSGGALAFPAESLVFDAEVSETEGILEKIAAKLYIGHHLIRHFAMKTTFLLHRYDIDAEHILHLLHNLH